MFALAEHTGTLDLLLPELGIDPVEVKVLRSHSLFEKVTSALALHNSLNPDELLAKSEGHVVKRLLRIIHSSDDKMALSAVKEVLDRVKGKPVQTNRTISTSVNLDVSVEDLKRERLEAEQRLEVLRKKQNALKKVSTIDAVLADEASTQPLTPATRPLSLIEV